MDERMIRKLEGHLRGTFANARIVLTPRPKQKDSAEVYVGEEFVGVVFEDEDGALTEVPVTGGAVKLQWKPDWACRWTALDVDYEMAGKDLIDSVKVSSQMCRILGGAPPEGFNFELFLDEPAHRQHGVAHALEVLVEAPRDVMTEIFDFHGRESSAAAGYSTACTAPLRNATRSFGKWQLKVLPSPSRLRIRSWPS